jgi:hypothetical protein
MSFLFAVSKSLVFITFLFRLLEVVRIVVSQNKLGLAILDREYSSASVFLFMPCSDIHFETYRLRIVDRLKTAFVTSIRTKTTSMHDPYL